MSSDNTKMPKINRSGKAEILTAHEMDRLYKALEFDHHRLLFLIAQYTGERWGAIVQLKVGDLYSSGSPRDSITFHKSTRKRSAGRDACTRQVPIHSRLKAFLATYTPPIGGYLFPSSVNSDRHLTTKACDNFIRKACIKLSWQHRGISLHTTRRSFITQLHANGADIRTIQAITGHADLRSLSGYVEVSQDRIVHLISQL